MRIKSLQITGFKSFVDKTVFSFGPGITGVVGPNGCGKSNVVDAMRWAMGEQSPRHLRGKNMNDVIFAGAEGRPPVGMAEVVLTFDNTAGTAPPDFAAYSEIQVARRLYRTGESEYLLNKISCRLRDVLDFFRDTGIGTKGYTIVEQGQIASIVSSKPDERRHLIEEAAGISKYKARRHEAERKLKATEQNLLRVSDVVGEIRRQISSIERQARKAARYKRLRETQRLLELTLAADERRALAAEIETVQRELVALRDSATALESQLSQREASLEERRLALAERERILNQGNEALYELRSKIKDLESQVAYENRERGTLAESAAAKREEQADLRERERLAGEDLAQADGELRSVEALLAGEAEALANAEQEARSAGEALRTLESERDAGSAALVEVLTGIARSEDRLAALDDRRAELDGRLRSTDEQLDVQQSEATQIENEQRHLEEGLRNLLSERDRLMGALRTSLERHERGVAAAGEARDALHTSRERRETQRARLESLREVLASREDVSAAARNLLSDGESAGRFGLRGLVRDLVEVDREFERAVGAVLAERAEALVADGLEGALAAVDALRGADAGRGVFVVEPPAAPLATGLVPLGEPLIERVRPRPGAEGVARTLLANVYLVGDLREVARVYGGGRIPASFVTREGDVLTPDGVVRGGGEAAGAALFARAGELRELEAELEPLDREVTAREAASRAAEAERVASADEVENLRNRHHTAALAVANHEKDLERTRERAKSMGEAQEGRVAERSAVLSEVENLGGDRERIDERLVTLRRERSERQNALDALGSRIASAGRELARLEGVVTERKVAHAGRVEKRDRVAAERARAEAALQESRDWIRRRDEEIQAAEARRSQLAESVRDAESSLADRLREEEAARATNTEKRDHYEREAESMRGLENAVRELRRDASQRREKAGQAELGVREKQMRLQHLDDSIRDKWLVELATWTPPEVAEAPPAAAAETQAGEGAPEADADAAEAADPEAAEEAALAEAAARDVRELSPEKRREFLADVRKKLEALGEVNLGAIEEHEELAERFRFLSEQKADLETSVSSLRDAITRINRTSRKRFRETFEQVNEGFRRNFPRLFGGGKAELVLTESDDVLEAGVDIVAMPPGKRLQNVNLLSGGEKTLTAIALLVSLFQVRPSPFFLLDEVDAALDDANVGRFNSIVREMSKESQFLVITHNKRTIEIGDMLYGVTMQEKGVSKLVSVELH